MLVRHKNTCQEHVQEIATSRLSKLLTIADRILWKFGWKSSIRNTFGLKNCWHNTYKLIKGTEAYQRCDLVHLHNIHGEFFDTKAVQLISRDRPIVWTLHDQWLLTGGEGCDLPRSDDYQLNQLYPLKPGALIRRRKYWKQYKRKLVSQISQHLNLVTPSDTHKKKCQIALDGVRVNRIYYGIDTDTFHWAEKAHVTAKILLFNSSSPYKNSSFVLNSLDNLDRTCELLVLGNPITELSNTSVRVSNLGYISNRDELAKIYRDADICITNSRCETFGLIPAELASTGALVFLNHDLEVFHEHHKLYGAKLYKDKSDLVYLIRAALDNLADSRSAGKKSSESVSELLNRKDTIDAYKELYKAAIFEWNKE